MTLGNWYDQKLSKVPIGERRENETTQGRDWEGKSGSGFLTKD